MSMDSWKSIITPFDETVARSLRAGDHVRLSGVLFTARDKAHERIGRILKEGGKLPFDLKDQVLYYVGPSPAPPGRIVGAAGPTTSSRMDPATEMMLKLGVRGFIGKGKRSDHVISLLGQYGAVYFGTYGGAAVYLSRCITSSRLVAFEDLGPEAVYRFEVKDFPAIVVNDTEGGDTYEAAIRRSVRL